MTSDEPRSHARRKSVTPCTSLSIAADNKGDCPIYRAQLVETEQAM